MMQLGWFSTGRDEAARNLLKEVWDRRGRGELDIDIPFVFCNREPGEAPGSREGAERESFFQLVRELGIELLAASHIRVEPELRKRGLRETTDHAHPSPTLLDWRDIYGQKVIDLIEGAGHDPKVCVLAGYMLIWSPVECRRFDAVNLHPALPWGPTGTWQEVIWELMQKEAGEQGAMMHLVTPELDRGPPVAYCSFPIRGGDWDPLWERIDGTGLPAVRETEGEDNALFRRIRSEGEARELPLIAHTVGEIAAGRLEIRNKWPYREGKRIESGADLSELIEAEMARGRG
jgi:phosphoribosylglycinamide formyltransferase-1